MDGFIREEVRVRDWRKRKTCDFGAVGTVLCLFPLGSGDYP